MGHVLEIIAPRSPADLRIGPAICAALRQHVPRTKLRLTGAHVTVEFPWSTQQELELALAALTVWNVRALAARPLPPLYESGVRYAREPRCGARVCEEFLTAHETIARGAGDCDDLGGWRAAEGILQGRRDRAVPIRSSVGWHIVVRRGDGLTEDPSRRLGMPGGH